LEASLANAIEERGQFWWFGEEGQNSSLENSVHGLLVVSEEGQIALQLEGPLWLESPNVSWEWDASRWLGAEKRIVGRLGESGSAGYVLLHELLRTDFSLANEPARQSYEAGFCFKNDRDFPSNFDLDHFSSLRIELEGLEEWLRLEAIDLGEEVYLGNQVEFTVKYDRVEIGYDTPRAKVSIENLVLGASPFRLFHSLVARVDIRQTNWLVYEPKGPFALAELQMSFRRLEEIIALLVGQYFRLDWPKLVAKFGESDDWFTLYWKRGPRHEAAPSVFLMMTTFPLVRDDFGTMLGRWEAGAIKYGAGYDLYMASMQQPLPYPEHQFVNLIWAIESLHRGWQRDQGESPRVEQRKEKIVQVLSRFLGEDDKKLRKWLAGKLRYAYEPKLEDRIVESFQRLPFELDPRELRSFAERCARRRNDISHEGGSRPGEDATEFRSELRILSEALQYLFHGLLLHEAGLNRNLLLKALTRGGIGSMRIVPALHAVGIALPAPPREDKLDRALLSSGFSE
jgi:hypothetical protein